MKKIITHLLFVITTIHLQAQYSKVEIPQTAKVVSTGTKSRVYICTSLGDIYPASVDLSWKPLLTKIPIVHHSEKNEELEAIKKIKNERKANAAIHFYGDHSDLRGGGSPTIGANFQGNANTGTSPLDNSIAISNGGRLVSVANTSIEFYNTNGSVTFSNTIESFFNDPAITDICDPVVIYDSGADKFIFFAQECSGSPDNTNLLICFSKTNNPNSGWWRYKLTGDPEGNQTWFDYPKLAVSNNELYITGNAFDEEGNFQKALLYQIEKNNGFNGGNINWQYWTDITANPFTLLPVSYGQQGNYGPGIYLVTTESSGSASIELYDLTDDLSATNEQLLHYTLSTTEYSPAGDGLQFGTSTGLDNGDCRPLSGFYLNGIIHFVFHSDYTDGYNGINYNRLDVGAQTDDQSMFGLDGYEYAYPSVASFASSDQDKSVMIGFGRTGSTIYPEIRAVYCDNAMNWGNSSLVRIGDGYADYTASGGDPERWGDYTGIYRKHNNSTPTAWMSGMYGTTSNDWSTWIAEITGSGSMTAIHQADHDVAFKLYPNPAHDQFKTEFDIDQSGPIQIDIIDESGLLIKTLYHGSGSRGKNQFTCNTSQLSTGTYFISIIANHQPIKNEKIIIVD